MINRRYSIAMSETLHYLKGINQDDIDKIPNKFMLFLKENADDNYSCNFDYNKPLKELNLTNEAKGIIAMICLNYWCETEEPKPKFRNYLNINEQNYQEKLKKIYNVDNIFKNRNNTVNNNNNNINSNVDEKTDKEHNPNLPARVQKKQNIFLRVLGLIKKLINY